MIHLTSRVQRILNYKKEKKKKKENENNLHLMIVRNLNKHESKESFIRILGKFIPRHEFLGESK